MSTDQAIEQHIQAVGANVAPRITPDDIAANIVSEHYFTAADGVVGSNTAVEMCEAVGESAAHRTKQDLPHVLNQLTFCVLVLKNGFTVTGESACASPENYNAEIGRRIARENAVAKVWPLMGYELRSKLVFGSVGGDLATLGKLDFIGSVEPLTDNDANPLLSFGDALEVLKAGAKVARLGWNGKGMWLQFWKPMHTVDLPYIILLYPVGSAPYPVGARVPWLPSQTDMLAEDWQVVE